MNKHSVVVSLHTIVGNKTQIIDNVTETYTSKHFIDVFILFGQATRKVALLYIKKHLDIVAGVMRSKEMTYLHNELMASCDHDSLQAVEAKMCSFFLDPVTQHQQLLRMYKHASYLYSTLRSGKVHCSKADTFFLEKSTLGKVHHYSCAGYNSLLDQGSGGLCLCILIATGLNTAFSGSLTLKGGTSKSKFVYKMSAGDTCLLYGMYFLLDTGFCLTNIPDSFPLNLPSGSNFSFRVNDHKWCQSSKPIFIVFNYRPGAAALELPVGKSNAPVPHSLVHANGTAQVGMLALVTPCTKKKSCDMITNKNQVAGDKLSSIVAYQTCIHGSKRDSQPAQITPCPVKFSGETPVVAWPLTYQIVEIYVGDSPLSKLIKCMDFKRKSRSGTNSSRFIIHFSTKATKPDTALAKSFLTSVFHNSENFIQWTLKPDSDSFDQMTFFILAETNQGLEEVLALAHVKFYPGRGILLRWLAVTGKNILTAQFGGNQDSNGRSWRKHGLSTLLLALAQYVGKFWFQISSPKMFAEVRADDAQAQSFYKKKGFIKVNQFPAFVDKDLHSHYDSQDKQGGSAILSNDAESGHGSVEMLNRLELNHWVGKVGDILAPQLI